MDKIKTQLIPLKMKIQINKVQHQYSNTECGVYSIYFITQQLDKKRSFNEICNRIVNDAKMNAMRKVYFYFNFKPITSTYKLHFF